MKKSNIYVYSGEGASKTCVFHTLNMLNDFLDTDLYHISEIMPDKIINFGLNDTSLLVIPGGADLPYKRDLDGVGNRNIRKYVESGGRLLAICAGAYYASSFVRFNEDCISDINKATRGPFVSPSKAGVNSPKNDTDSNTQGKPVSILDHPIQIVGERELKFFSGECIGPLLRDYYPDSNEGAMAASIIDEGSNKKIKVFYNGGGYFYDDKLISDHKLLYSYYEASDSNRLDAIILVKCGKGKVILSGVHFEYDPSRMAMMSSEGIGVEDEYIEKIIPELAEYEDDRRGVVTNIFKQLDLLD